MLCGPLLHIINKLSDCRRSLRGQRSQLLFHETKIRRRGISQAGSQCCMMQVTEGRVMLLR
jgi:hypothetical protein